MSVTFSPGTAALRLHAQLVAGRASLGMTQQQVADRLGVDRRTFQRWEDGEIEPRLTDAFRWAKAVGIEIASAPINESGISAASALLSHPNRSAAAHCVEDGANAAFGPVKTSASISREIVQ